MCNLKEYIQKLEQKTLFIVCNDCHCLNAYASNPKVIVCTAFGMMVNPKQGFDADCFRYYIEQVGVKQIVLVGHYSCQVLEFLLKNQQANEHWPGHHHYLRKLKKSYEALTHEEVPYWKKLVQYHISKQLANLSLLNFVEDLGIEGGIPYLKGIVLDEEAENKVIEIDHLGAILLPLSLN